MHSIFGYVLRQFYQSCDSTYVDIIYTKFFEEFERRNPEFLTLGLQNTPLVLF